MNEFSTIGAIIIYILLFLFIKHIIKIAIIGPKKRRKIKKEMKENSIFNKRITALLKNKYDVNFRGEYTLIIYDFIKTKIETCIGDKVRYPDAFSKSDLLEYIYLQEVYDNSVSHNFENYITIDNTKKEIELIIQGSLKEIKDYLYSIGIHFPYYNLCYLDMSWCNRDKSIEENKDFLKRQIDDKDDEYVGQNIFYKMLLFIFIVISFFSIYMGLFLMFLLGISWIVYKIEYHK